MHPEIFYKRYKKAHYDMKTPNEAAYMSRAACPLEPSHFPVLSDLHAAHINIYHGKERTTMTCACSELCLGSYLQSDHIVISTDPEDLFTKLK